LSREIRQIVTTKALKEKEKGIMTMSKQQKDVINNSEPKVKFRAF
jgi:hypothetical protein